MPADPGDEADEVPDLRHRRLAPRVAAAGLRAGERLWQPLLGFVLAVVVVPATLILIDSWMGAIAALLLSVAEVALGLWWSWTRRRRIAHGIVAALIVAAALGAIVLVFALMGGFGLGHD